jgi:hypothetical protein
MNGINGDNGVNLILLLLLENISLSWNLKHLLENIGYLTHLSFLGGHRNTYLFNIPDTCPFFNTIYIFFFGVTFA